MTLPSVALTMAQTVAQTVRQTGAQTGRLGRRATLAGAACALARAAQAPPDSPGLNQRAFATGRFFGTAVDDAILAQDPAYMARVRAECGMVTGETAFKWAELRPSDQRWNWAPADALMAFARRRSIQVRGHTLLWHEHNPEWLVRSLTPGTAAGLLTAHVRGVLTHCRDRVVQWDVVNEVLEPEQGQPLGLRKTMWSDAMGDRLLPTAFHACAEADPLPLRFINDYGMAYTWPEHERKRAAMLDLLRWMLATGVPVQGVGLQAHLEAGVMELDQGRLSRFVAEIAAMGLAVVVTELDVRDNRVAGDAATRDAAVASHTRAYLDAVLGSGAVLGVVSWGLSDRRSWLNDTVPRSDKQAQRALPLDADLRRKPMWDAIAAAFAAAPPR